MSLPYFSIRTFMGTLNILGGNKPVSTGHENHLNKHGMIYVSPDISTISIYTRMILIVMVMIKIKTIIIIIKVVMIMLIIVNIYIYIYITRYQPPSTG